MKPGINLVSVFERVQSGNGEDYFIGTLDLSTLKKTKRDEIKALFMAGNLLPDSIHGLL